MSRVLSVATLALLILIAGQGTAVGQAVVGFGVDARERPVAMLEGTRRTPPLIVRFAADGSLDASFAAEGILRPALSGLDPGLVVQRGGGLVVGGTRGRKVILRRYRPTGGPDPNFGGKGSALITYGGPLQRLLLQPGGQVIALATHSCSASRCGYVYNNLEVRRFTAGGRLLHEYLLSEEAWELHAVGMDPRGGFVVTGNVWDLESQTYDRFWPSGAWASSIYRDVSLKFRDEGGEEEVSPGIADLTIDADGKLLLAVAYEAELWLRNRNGSADFSFGEGGRILCHRTPGAKEPFVANADFAQVEIAADGKFVAAGGLGECGLVRYLPDGTPDPSFGGDGTVNVEAAGMGQPEAISLLPDGGVLLADWDKASGALRLARFTAEGTLTPGFGAGGIATLPVAAAG